MRVVSVVMMSISMKDGGVDRTVADCQQNKLGQVSDFPHLLTFWLFKLNIRPCVIGDVEGRPSLG